MTFEAAHRLPNVPPGHKCSNLHGHSYRCEVAIVGDVDPVTGWFVDFADIAAAFAKVHKKVDHRYLNEVVGLENPTAENIAAWIWNTLAPNVPGLACVTLREGFTSGCVYRGPT